MEELLKDLIEKEDKCISCNEKFIIRNIELVNKLDQIRLDLQQNNTIYKDVAMIKGLTFPIPKVLQVILVKKIFLKYNEEFELNLFIEGNIDKDEEKPKLLEDTKHFSFESKEIYKTISLLAKIDLPKINSMIFIIIEILDMKVNIKSISDSNIYEIELKPSQISNFKSNDFLWICNYELIENKIVLNKMSTIQIFKNEKLLEYLDILDINGVSIFQVVDIDKENIILVDKNKNIYKIDKSQEIIENKNIDYYTTIIISNYSNNNNKIELTSKSFFYKFPLECYYIENIIINLYSVLEFHFLDFLKGNNLFDCISSPLIGEKIIISNEIECIIFENIFSKEYEFYPIQLILSNSKNENRKIAFTYYLYPSILNKVNVFLNTKNAKTYLFEYFYYNLTDNLEEIEKNIIIGDNNYNINIYDSFGSKNRKRICIMNIPYQKMEIKENELNNNSIQICELIENDIHKIIGIYDIYYEFKDKVELNEYFDKYYESFGDIYNIMRMPYPSNLEDNLISLKNKINIFNMYKFDKDLTNTNNFSKLMTLSQFKSWFGLIVCSFMEKKKKMIYFYQMLLKKLIIYLMIL